MAPRFELYDRLLPLLERSLADIGYELVELELRGGPGTLVVCIYADREGGVSIDDCVTISRYLGDVLDVEDPIKYAYRLEVSSPGLNRPLRKVDHFQRVLNETIKVLTHEPLDGRRRFRGILKVVSDEMIEVEVDGKPFQIPLSTIEKANLVYEFE